MNKKVFFVCCVVLGLASCGGGSPPSEEKIAAAIRSRLSDGYGFTLERFEALPMPGMDENFVRINFKGRVVTKEARFTPLYQLLELFKEHGVAFPNDEAINVSELVDDDDTQATRQAIQNEEAQSNRHEWESLPAFANKVVEAEQVAEVTGRCSAEKRLDEWLVNCGGFDSITGSDIFEGQTWEKLISQITQNNKKLLDTKSSEAKTFFVEYGARVQQRKQKWLTDLSARQTERKQIRSQYMPYVSQNGRYEGIFTYVDRRPNGRVNHEGSLRVLVSFTVEGKRIKARLENLEMANEYTDMEQFWPDKTQSLSTDPAHFPLIMRTTQSRYQLMRHGPEGAVKLFSNTNATVDGFGFKFEGNTLTGSMQSKQYEYQISATLVR